MASMSRWLVGFVQQQHVRPRDEGLRQRHALARAAGEVAHLRLRGQPQPLQRLVHALLPGPALQRLDARLQRIQVQPGELGATACASAGVAPAASSS
jgi:hypothetical protein